MLHSDIDLFGLRSFMSKSISSLYGHPYFFQILVIKIPNSAQRHFIKVFTKNFPTFSIFFSIKMLEVIYEYKPDLVRNFSPL